MVPSMPHPFSNKPANPFTFSNQHLDKAATDI
jgi:hypothetical protein